MNYCISFVYLGHQKLDIFYYQPRVCNMQIFLKYNDTCHKKCIESKDILYAYDTIVWENLRDREDTNAGRMGVIEMFWKQLVTLLFQSRESSFMKESN